MREKLKRLFESNVLPSVLFAALLVTALVFLDELRAWFSLADDEPPPPAASAPARAGHGPAPVEPYAFSDPALAALRGALDEYEEVRVRLAADSTEGLKDKGRAIAELVRRASAAAAGAPRSMGRALLDAGAAAEKLAAAGELAAARAAFADLSRAMVALAGADARLREGFHLYTCSMTEGYSQWLQKPDKIANPYQGEKMLTCGEPGAYVASAPADGEAIVSHEGHGHAGDDIAYWTCPMHPSVKKAEQGPCPICGMDLTPVTYDEEEGGVIIVDALRRQRVGVRIGEVSRGPMVRSIRTVGKLTYDETKLHDITLKYQGWIQKLYVDAVGKRVERGTALFAVYSPEVYAAQGDLLVALSDGDGMRKRDPLVDVAKKRLQLLDAYGLDKHLEETGKPVRYITVTSPADGYVVEKNVVDGSAFEPGARVMRIAGLDTVWIQAELYESELGLVKEGQEASVSLSYLPDKRYRGEVRYVYPYLDPKTRTGKARIELKNPELELKPDMYANVAIEVDLGERLRVPEAAIVYTGRRRLVFVDLGEGRLVPREVKLGVHAGDHYEVLAGLSAGQEVVTSGNFLIAAESRIRSAARYWGASDDEPGADEAAAETPAGHDSHGGH